MTPEITNREKIRQGQIAWAVLRVEHVTKLANLYCPGVNFSNSSKGSVYKAFANGLYNTRYDVDGFVAAMDKATVLENAYRETMAELFEELQMSKLQSPPSK
jgi:hypothetical protein